MKTWINSYRRITETLINTFKKNTFAMTKKRIADLSNPRNIVLNKEVKVSNGIKGHQHREKNVLPKQYFKIHEEDFDT